MPEEEKKPDLTNPMSKGDYRRFMFTATLTALGVGLVFSAVMVAFVLFCWHVWLR